MALRVKDISGMVDTSTRQQVADYFGIDIKLVGVEKQPETFSITISDNTQAQELFKAIAPYGNVAGRPGRYNFQAPILVFWTGTKVQPAKNMK